MKNYPDEHANATPTNYRTFDHGPRKGETIIFLHGGNAAGWTWYGQVELMPDRHVLTPDLLGYAGRADEEWPGFAGAADDIAELIRTRAIEGRAHVVGLSLGGFVATYLLHRHPEVVRSCLMSGSALAGYSRVERAVVGAQVGLWRQRWYWAVQAALFRIPADSREQYIRDASAASHRSNRAMLRETLNHRLPTGDFDFDGPVLAVAAERDSASVRRAFPTLQSVLPQTQTWIAPGVHHAWNAESPELFARMVTEYADTGRWNRS